MVRSATIAFWEGGICIDESDQATARIAQIWLHHDIIDPFIHRLGRQPSR